MKALLRDRHVAVLAGLAVARLSSATAWAQAAGPATASATGSAAVNLVVDLAPGAPIDAERLRAAVAQELGAPVVWRRDGKGGTLVVRQEGDRVVVSFDDPDGRHDGRAIPLANDPAQAEREIALLAGNVARDQAAQFIAPPASPAAGLHPRPGPPSQSFLLRLPGHLHATRPDLTSPSPSTSPRGSASAPGSV